MRRTKLGDPLQLRLPFEGERDSQGRPPMTCRYGAWVRRRDLIYFGMSQQVADISPDQQVWLSARHWQKKEKKTK